MRWPNYGLQRQHKTKWQNKTVSLNFYDHLFNSKTKVTHFGNYAQYYSVLR